MAPQPITAICAWGCSPAPSASPDWPNPRTATSRCRHGRNYAPPGYRRSVRLRCAGPGRGRDAGNGDVEQPVGMGAHRRQGRGHVLGRKTGKRGRSPARLGGATGKPQAAERQRPLQQARRSRLRIRIESSPNSLADQGLHTVGEGASGGLAGSARLCPCATSHRRRKGPTGHFHTEIPAGRPRAPPPCRAPCRPPERIAPDRPASGGRYPESCPARVCARRNPCDSARVSPRDDADSNGYRRSVAPSAASSAFMWA